MTNDNNNKNTDNHKSDSSLEQALKQPLSSDHESLSDEELNIALEQAEPSAPDLAVTQATESKGLEHIDASSLELVEQEDNLDKRDCLNCATPLNGPYCHNCGQPDRHFIRFFPKVLWEMVNEAFDFDSRAFRTLIPLLLSPGRLSMEYIAGRRARYVNPLRLYIILSVLFFITINIMTSNSDLFDDPVEPNKGVISKTVIEETPEEIAAAKKARQQKAKAIEEELTVTFDGGEKWHPETNPIGFGGWLSPENAQQANYFLWQMYDKFKETAKSSPKDILEEFLNAVPQIMFFLLPLFALLLKFTYIFKKRYYMEHLIVALHSHCFIFFSLLLILLIGSLEDMFKVDTWPEQFFGYVLMALIIWIPVNLYITQKRIYAQGYFMTSLKYFFVGISYSFMLGFAALAAFVVGVASL